MTITRVLRVEDLERWTQSGAHWHIIHLSAEQATVELCACTGEPVERLQTTDPQTVRFLHRAGEGLKECR
jgi:hypothetical protein